MAETEIPGLRVVERIRLEDRRGYLQRLFCADEIGDAGWSGPIAQVNHTCTRDQGTVRGMHFQRPPHADAKLVLCLRGAVFDVAVDLRVGSATRFRWHAEMLTPENGRALLIPKGFAHGFQALVPDVELLYLHSAPYVAASEDGIHPADPALDIRWPLPVVGLSERDRNHPPLTAESPGVRS